MNSKKELLDVFTTEEDRNGTDLMEMSDFFDVFMDKIDMDIDSSDAWNIYQNVEGMLGEIASAIKSGFDISKMGMLIADYSHFSQDIIDGLKNGIYHVGQSKEVAGNMRPAILDDKEQLVKFFTLKKAINPSEVLSDVSTLSMQASLQRISAQIEEISYNVKTEIDFVRREALSTKFIYAREKIMLAANAENENEREEYLKEADTYLMEGLGSLYADINHQVEELAKQKGPLAKLNRIDSLLSYINEDMQMMPKYVGLRVYLLNYRKKYADSSRILMDYRQQIYNMSERKSIDGKYSALELVHKYYPYRELETDFWLNHPKNMISAIDKYENMIEQKDADIFYIDVEE
ncbi:hypothetical protein SAMN02910289_00648 [Lachnospiraceae bacterium RM5]|nr:hypothetical protein SAMN02910289_00648 [Lachnospiraceae bacterium RM5]